MWRVITFAQRKILRPAAVRILRPENVIEALQNGVLVTRITRHAKGPRQIAQLNGRRIVVKVPSIFARSPVFNAAALSRDSSASAAQGIAVRIASIAQTFLATENHRVRLARHIRRVFCCVQ